MNEEQYDQERNRRNSDVGYLETGYEPKYEFYGGLDTMRSVDIEHLYASSERVRLDTSHGFWRPLFHLTSVGLSSEFESLIFLCPARIVRKAKELVHRLPDVSPASLEKCVFRVVLMHEVGHHYTLANFATHELRRIMSSPDLNILDGLANWFANMMLGKEEKWVQAEMAIDQRTSYRYYLYFKHADVSALLDCFLAETDYSRAPAALSHVIGGQHVLNGYTLTVEREYDGVAMDWSGEGGVIIAGEAIKALGTMKSGCFVTPRIGLLIGRFPRDTLIVANEITSMPDYGRIPSNIIIIPRDKKDLRVIIKDHLADAERIRLQSILHDAGVLMDIGSRRTES